jgi:hypothetical protein
MHDLTEHGVTATGSAHARPQAWPHAPRCSRARAHLPIPQHQAQAQARQPNDAPSSDHEENDPEEQAADLDEPRDGLDGVDQMEHLGVFCTTPSLTWTEDSSPWCSVPVAGVAGLIHLRPPFLCVTTMDGGVSGAPWC